jgi:hypothetical protein
MMHWPRAAGFKFTGFRGLSLPPNSPEHRAHGKGDSWRI